jgi:hypothetical protein
MPTLIPRRPVRRLTLTIAVAVAILGCDREPLGTDPDFAKSGPTPLTAIPSSLWLRVGPPTFTATVTARVQYVGLITSKSSDQSCATAAPASVPAATGPRDLGDVPAGRAALRLARRRGC